MSNTLYVKNVYTPDGSPVNFPNGITIGKTNNGLSPINNIGTPNSLGFGVGIAPSLPYGMEKLYGSEDPYSDNYGNYLYSDSSVMVYKPSFYYKYGTGANGLVLNTPDIKPLSFFSSVAAANAQGYAIHRSAYNNGSIRPGYFEDKYLCSNNNGVASSLKNGIVLTSAQRGSLTNTPFSSLNGAPSNNLAGSIAASKTRGSSFFPTTLFMHGANALLSLAQAKASTSTMANAWYDSTGANNFPKGNNNNALGDVNDSSIAYVYDGNGTYLGCGKTGSANFFAKTTHNGQNNGVADLNGLVWEANPFGVTSEGTSFFLLNKSVDFSAMTGGNTLATDTWGTAGLTALYTNIGATIGALDNSTSNKVFGNANQVLSEATSGIACDATGAGIPLVGGVGGSNTFGNDFFYSRMLADVCVFSGGSWDGTLLSGVFALAFSTSRLGSSAGVGFRSALYL